MKPPKRMFFRKSSKGGGGGHFQSENLYCRFWTFKQGFLSMKMIQKGHFRVQGMFFQQLYWEKSKQDTLWRRHFWTPPLLEMFRKFIRFGDAIRPYWKRTVGVFPSDNLPTATINPVLFKIRKFCTSVTVPGQNDNLLKSTCLSNLCTWIVLWLCWCHSAMQVSQCAIKFARAGNTAGTI